MGSLLEGRSYSWPLRGADRSRKVDRVAIGGVAMFGGTQSGGLQVLAGWFRMVVSGSDDGLMTPVGGWQKGLLAGSTRRPWYLNVVRTNNADRNDI